MLLLAGPASSETLQPSDIPAAVTGAELEAVETERRDLLNAILLEPGDVDQSLRYAKLSITAGDLEAAISTLERLLIFSPGLRDLQLELGILYYRLGAVSTAEDYWRKAAASTGADDDISQRAREYLETDE